MKRLFNRMREHGIVRDLGNGLVSVPSLGPSRRDLLAGAAGLGALAITPSAPAHAAADVKFMGWQGYDDAFSAGDFLKQKNITLSATYMTDNNQLIATANGGGKGTMQIITPDTAYTPFMADIDMLEPLDEARIPNIANLFPEFRTIPGPEVKGVRYSLPFVWGSIPLMYDPSVVTTKPTSWLDMMDPRYKGRVALTNDVISVIVPFTMTVAKTRTPTRITKAQLDATIDVLIKLKKDYCRAIAPGYGELADMFASGEIVMAQGWEPVAIWAADKGKKIDFTIPKEGTHTLCDCLAVVKGAPDMDVVYQLLNQGLSSQAQAAVSNKNSTGATVSGAVPLLDERVRKIFPYDDISGFFKQTGGGPFPLWPATREGDFVSMDDVLDGWERFLKA